MVRMTVLAEMCSASGVDVAVESCLVDRACNGERVFEPSTHKRPQSWIAEFQHNQRNAQHHKQHMKDAQLTPQHPLLGGNEK